MTFKEITELVKLVTKSNLTEFKVKDGEFELAIRTDKYSKTRTTQVLSSPPQMLSMAGPAMHQPAAPAAPESAPEPEKEEKKVEDTSKYLEVLSPIVGTFYRSPSPDKPPYLKIGDEVAVGDTVCIVEAMKLFNEIESEVAGRVVKVLVEEAQPVEYNQVLFLVDPS
ncbi:MAG: acetyl-CoA carboxylase biotin carboxyl carrier protein [Paraglaciecola sp.]|jgi:acetyl-CoA carboxylase biotin carboxyl carrier protein